MPSPAGFAVTPVGHVRSPATDPATAPKQGDEGAPRSAIVLAPEVAEAAGDLGAGTDVLVFTWLHLADRAVLRTHPRDDPALGLRGVFSTRSPDRPNPIGLHRVRIVEVSREGASVVVTVDDLEAVDGTPVIDVKPVIGPAGRER